MVIILSYISCLFKSIQFNLLTSDYKISDFKMIKYQTFISSLNYDNYLKFSHLQKHLKYL